MLGNRHRARTAALAVALICPLAGAASADAKVLDQHRAGDGTSFTLIVERDLSGRQSAPTAAFRLTARMPPGRDNPFDGGLVSSAALDLAGRQSAIVGSTLACSVPGAAAVYGTVVRRVRRAVAVLVGGRKVRLTRRKPPRAWNFDGWVVGGVVGARRPVREVRVFDRAGQRFARARFSDPQACPPAE